MQIRVVNLYDEVAFKCLDEDTASSDLVGEGSIKLQEVEQLPESDKTMWVQIYYKGKSAGKIQFEFEYLPEMYCPHAEEGE